MPAADGSLGTTGDGPDIVIAAGVDPAVRLRHN
jgi:hypothetical protein